MRVAREDALPCRDLVCGLGIGVQEADRDGFRAARQQQVDLCIDRFKIDRRQHFAVEGHTLGNFEAQRALDKRRCRSVQEIVNGFSAAAAHLQNVAEAFRGQQADLRALFLNKRVHADGHAVEDLLDAVDIDIETFDALEELLVQLVRNRRNLLHAGGAGGLVHQNEVHKCAAYVYGDPIAILCHALPLSIVCPQARPGLRTMNSVHRRKRGAGLIARLHMGDNPKLFRYVPRL